MKTITALFPYPALNISVIWIGLILVFLTDLYTPLGFAHGVLYVPVLAGAMLLPGVSQRMQIGVLLTGLTTNAVAYLLLPNFSNLPEIVIIGNRVLSALILCLIYIYLRNLRTVKRQNVEIKDLEQLQRKTMHDFIEAMPVQVWSADASGAIDFVSNSLAEFSGESKESIVDNWLSFLHPDDRENTVKIWSRSVATGDPYRVDFRLRRYDGEHVWFKTQAVAQLDEEGKILRWFGSSIDIDDLRILQEKTERLASKFRHTVESITDAFFTLDHEFRFTFVNQKAAEILGGSAEDMLGEIIWEECPIGYQSPFAKKYRRVAKEKQKLHFEEYFAPKGKWLEVHAYPSSDGISVYFSDITTSRIERERLKLLDLAVSRLNDIIIITKASPLDAPGPETVYVNEAFEKVTGYSASDIIGKSPRMLQGPKTNRIELDKIKTALIEKKSIRTQLVNYTKSGEEYHLEIEIVPLINDTGACTHLVAIERDITDRLELERRLRESQKLEAVGHLTGGIAHDFNNLLTVILGNSEMMVEQTSDSDLKAMTQMTLSAARRGAELTSRLLAFARRQPLDPKPTDLKQLLEGMRALIRRTLPRDIELEIITSLDLGITEIDAGELETALLNLVINARDAMDNGGRLTIEANNAVLDESYAARHSEVTPGDYVMVCVSDTGSGMDANTISQVFEPFFTTKTVGKGSGLGLSMVFGFTKQSGGHIKIYSELNEGTSVKLYFPRVKSVYQERYEVIKRNQPKGGTEHILMAEDDDLVKQSLQRQLRSLGYRVTAVNSGPEALNALEAHSDIDLLLTDIVMPGGMNGRELADRAKERFPTVKVLFTSGYTENAIVHHGRLDRGVTLLSKPYTRLELASKVRFVLDE
ncbi:PAS domain S-box/PAS domain S-box/PAS domain S-box [Idiomarina sp. A28L]|uniref:hybrid sensor histidine kinase/response regulator n=1 Tax=Idiomarina sp. A28L TaxID=1036674 RepID=UPI0002138AF2|nr:hybrid sensor histidine kinase/response regulator [Idiomarina sp. A28L]EGN75902.1 PAS domain S-box/PAS domain S-box/PAS domain S-box [Idiomarina sp. A28L]